MRYSSVLMVFFFMTLISCSCGSTKQAGSSPTDNKKHYLALGDSYTIGESVPESETYPRQLTETLNKAGENFAPPLIIARTGWTTANLQRGIQSAGIEGRKYDLVSLLIGVNNQFQGRSLEEYEIEFTALLEQAIGFAKDEKAVFVVSIPDYGFTPFGASRQEKISTGIDQFNAAAKRIAEEKNISFVDITPISRKGLENPELVAPDGLHPSGLMYSEFSKLIVNAISLPSKEME